MITVSASVNGESVLYISKVDGAVFCYTGSGQNFWRNPTHQLAVMFDIEAADIDGDGNNDLLTASADGSINQWGHDCLTAQA